jgi:hypothetical protein
MGNAKHIGFIWASAVALGIGLAVANTPAVALAAPDDNGKGSSSSESSPGHSGSKSSDTPSAKHASSAPDDTPGHQRRPPNKPNKDAVSVGTRHRGEATSRTASNSTPAKTTPKPAVVEHPTAANAPVQTSGAVSTSAVDPDFITSTHGFFGLFSVTSAADPDDNHYVAFVLRTPFFTNVLTSGTDPEDNLGFGAASIGVAGHTVNTFISPFLIFSIGIPVEDPFAELFTELVRLGF